MKNLLIPIVLAAAAASAIASELESTSATLTSLEPLKVQSFEGHQIQVAAVNVSIGGLTRFGRRRTVTFYATSLVETFLSGFSFCKSRQWNLASPKSDEEQKALEAVIAQSKFAGDTWLGSMCLNERWTWLSDGSFVNYNGFPTVGGLIGRTPSCGNESQVLMMFSPSVSNNGRWFKWGVGDMFKTNHVVCQDSQRRWNWRNFAEDGVVSVSSTNGRPRPFRRRESSTANPSEPQRIA